MKKKQVSFQIFDSTCISYISSVAMALDSFICGLCQITFNDINSFMSHKQEGCKPLDSKPTQEESDTGETTDAAVSCDAGKTATELGKVHQCPEIGINQSTESTIVNEGFTIGYM